MQNYIRDGVTMPVVLTAAAVSGVAQLIGGILGVPETSGAIGDTVAFLTEGVVALPKATGVNWTQGAALYWDNAAKNITNVASGNTLVGTAWTNQVNADTSCAIKLKGR